MNYKLHELQIKHQKLKALEQKLTKKHTKLQIKNETREEIILKNTDIIEQGNNNINHVYNDCIISNMKRDIKNNINVIEYKRFMYALQIFGMHRIEVGVDSNNDKKAPRGIGKISGLVLPHAGPALYGALPPYLLSSALRYVASCTNSVARCLGIHLPHSILLHDFNDENQDVAFSHIDVHNNISSSFTTSLASAGRAIARVTGMQQSHKKESFISQRIQHSTFAVLCEHNVHATTQKLSEYYKLCPPTSKQEEEEHFSIGLQFLQNDIIALCIKAGVSVDDLWPAEAILLNLHSLKLFCLQKVRV